ncbi:alpha/beta hydrolase [Hyphomonas sp.]|uniref:alpha/beta fold hydrolase n=1 Tax=Hyphomonas sp. TaxID=87 RepID=UPI0032EC0105
MAFMIPTGLSSSLKDDGEFKLVARDWTGGFRFLIGEDEKIEVAIENGVPTDGEVLAGDIITIRGPVEIWGALLQTQPPRFLNDLAVALQMGLQREGNDIFFTQYYPALARAVEIIRGTNPDQVQTISTHPSGGTIEAPVGRYVNLDLCGDSYRVYFEEAGTGIPILLQHTAGSHGIQWRHLLSCTSITDRFRLIAYDLPFHGKSVPPTGRHWWSEPYRLRGEFLRSIPLAFSDTMALERPVFMGCSVGGALALDLAARHAERFRAVISVEGGLKMDGDLADPEARAFFHPQVSNQYKGRLMHGLTSPTAPEAYRQETIQTYMSGWPQSFIGDLEYYLNEYDLRELAATIDTKAVAVHIMNGEYDYSGSWEKGEEAHHAIRGSTWTRMDGMGHFPMCEDPDRFIQYLMPILAKIEAAA